jgi:hypothetical protein
MRDRLLGVAGLAVVVGAAGWAFCGGPTAPVVTLVVIGLVLAAADAVVWRAAGDGHGDLAVPAGRRLPPPPWGTLVALAAAVGAVAAIRADAALAAGVFGLVGAGALTGMLRRRTGIVLEPQLVRTARRLRAFLRAHGLDPGEPAAGYVTAVGESGVRLLVVAPDGAWTDVMLGADAAQIAALARIELRAPDDPATGRRLQTGPRSWARMTDSW